jgi:glycolate oxidase
MHASIGKRHCLARESGASRHENRGEGMHAQTDTDAAREFADIVGESQLLTGERIGPDYHHDEALVGEPVAPRFVARPQTAEQVAALLAAATRAQMPVTGRPR